MAGKGFTVKKNWDNPREHSMPAELHRGPHRQVFVDGVGIQSCRKCTKMKTWL